METFNETLINDSLELKIDDYFEKFYSNFNPLIDKKFMKFLLNEDITQNNNFYISAEVLNNFELITTTKSSEILKLIKSANLIKNIDYTEKQKHITTGSKSALFYNELEYKFTLKSFKLLFILNKKNNYNNVKEWILYEDCYKRYVRYIKLYLINFNKIHLVNSNILDSNKELENKIIELNNDIKELKDNIDFLSDKADSLKIEFKDNMNNNIIDIKKSIKDILEFNNINKIINYSTHEKINSLHIYKLLIYNMSILFSLCAIIIYIL